MSVKHLIFVFCLIKCGAFIERPWKLPTCYRNDADLNKCLLESTKIVSPLLEKGIPELGVPPISPYFIPLIRYEQSNTKANYIYLMQNVTVTGLNVYNFTKFKFDLNKLKLVASFEIPHLTLEGNFSVNGKMLDVTLDRDGPFTLNISNSQGTIKQFLTLITRNEATYLAPQFDLTKLHVGAFSYTQRELDDVDTIREIKCNKAVKDYEANWSEYFKSVIEKELVRIITDEVLHSIYLVPYDTLLPVSE